MSSPLTAARSVASQIRSKILLSGPITVAEYMKLALTQTTLRVSNNKDPSTLETQQGYYMKNDVFGQKGDFITSPEITQIFGELLGVWGIQCWQQLRGPKKFNVVELGPGRGTLAKDMLRVFHQFESLVGSDVSLNLVEISPYLSAMQMQTLCNNEGICEDEENNQTSSNSSPTNVFQKGLAKISGYPVSWYNDIRHVPKEFSFYVAHEFFDALPAHKFQKKEDEWREVLVDVGKDNDDFSFVLSRNETPVLKVLKSRYPAVFTTSRSHLEISLEAVSILDELTSRLEAFGGIALIVDYGHDGTKEDTFRGFRKHQLHDPLIAPGTADLTTDVDFSIMKQIFSEKSLICGPVTQEVFLRRIGIEMRQHSLVKAAQSEEERKQLESSYKMIMEDMGSRFHFVGIFPKVLEQFLPKLKVVGFHE